MPFLLCFVDDGDATASTDELVKWLQFFGRIMMMMKAVLT